jgi:hypothetical protein
MWFLPSSNAQGWKAHLKSQHRITSTAVAAIRNTSQSGMDNEEGAALPSTGILQLQQTIKKPLPPHVVRRFVNAIVDYVIGGDISLPAAGEERFKQLVMSLTNGYAPPSTWTVLHVPVLVGESASHQTS